MARMKRRRPLAEVDYSAVLSPRQLCILRSGFELGPGAGFRDCEEYQAAWREHRDRLIFALRPFLRYEAFWFVDLHTMPPYCLAAGYESERHALVHRGLPL